MPSWMHCIKKSDWFDAGSKHLLITVQQSVQRVIRSWITIMVYFFAQVLQVVEVHTCNHVYDYMYSCTGFSIYMTYMGSYRGLTKTVNLYLYKNYVHVLVSCKKKNCSPLSIYGGILSWVVMAYLKEVGFCPPPALLPNKSQ